MSTPNHDKHLRAASRPLPRTRRWLGRALFALLLTASGAHCQGTQNGQGCQPTPVPTTCTDADVPAADGVVEYQGAEMQIHYRVRNGVAVWQNDMLVGDPSDVADGPARSGTVPTGNAWPGGRVPYRFDDSLTEEYRGTVRAAMDTWQNETGGVVTFVEKTDSDTDYALIRAQDDVCDSYVGEVFRGAQEMDLDMEGCGTPQILHELGHLLGLYHEQSRSDRDSYVDIFCGNINAGQKDNFEIAAGVVDVGAYDFASIMHYESHAFGNRDADGNQLVTIQRKDGGLIGPNNILSHGDVCGALHIYDAAQYQARCVDPQPVDCIRTEGPFAWSCSGPIDGYDCIQIEEPADPDTWEDNYFCAKPALGGIRWSYAGELPDPPDGCGYWDCIPITESNEPASHTWTDNYLCVFGCHCGDCLESIWVGKLWWSSNGPDTMGIGDCIQWDEPADQNGWHDNYLCWY